MHHASDEVQRPVGCATRQSAQKRRIGGIRMRLAVGRLEDALIVESLAKPRIEVFVEEVLCGGGFDDGGARIETRLHRVGDEEAAAEAVDSCCQVSSSMVVGRRVADGGACVSSRQAVRQSLSQLRRARDR